MQDYRVPVSTDVLEHPPGSFVPDWMGRGWMPDTVGGGSGVKWGGLTSLCPLRGRQYCVSPCLSLTHPLSKSGLLAQSSYSAGI
jgi:hypothetical protein